MKPESIVKILQIVLEDVTEGKFTITPVAPSEVEKDVAPVKDVEEVPVVEEPEEKEVEEETPVEEEVVEEPVKKEVGTYNEEEDLYAKKADELKDELNATGIRLYVNVNNPIAQKLYEACGYVEDGRAIFMEK